MTDVSQTMPYRDFIGTCTMVPDYPQMVELRGIVRSESDPLYDGPHCIGAAVRKHLPYVDLMSTVATWTKQKGREVTTVRLLP